MKKIALILIGIAFVSLSSCGEVENPEFQVAKDVSYDFDFSVPKTAGEPQTLKTSVNVNINEALDTNDSFDSLEITEFKFRFKDFQGAATTGIVSLKLKVNGTEIASIVDKKPSAEGEFTVTDAAKLNILRDAFLNSGSTTLETEATVQSDEAEMSFKVEISFRASAII